MLVHGLALCGEVLYAPAEIGYDAKEELVVPVDENGNFFNSYDLEVVRYRKNKLSDPQIVKVNKVNDYLVFDLDNFRVKLVASSNTIKYNGRLTHADFKHKFIIVTPVSNGIDDLIFEETGYVLVGCDAHEHYKGLT
jgi:hypothetical protein